MYKSWDIRYLLGTSGYSRHLQYTTYTDIGQYSHKCSHSIRPLKHKFSRWNFVAIMLSWDIRYSIFTSGYRSHLWFLNHSDIRQCLEQSNRVAFHRKYWYSRWTFVAISYTSWDTCYSIFSPSYWPPSLIYHSLWRRRVFALALPCFWTSQMAVSPGSSLISYLYREILVTSGL